jgi:uncharacterized membrane protein YhaH (DUF805 family)
MFKNPFSFEGRIRRTEFAISRLIFAGVIGILIGISAISNAALFLFILVIPLYWFVLAQNAKRCHDLNNSGWFMLIPLYGFWMLFAEGTDGENDYGQDPREEDSEIMQTY